jgi:hypothetical protein
MDLKMNSKTRVDAIDVSLVAEDGTVLDYHTITIDTEDVFAYPKETSWIKNILIGLGVLIVLLVIWAVVKKKINLTALSIFIAAILIGSSIFLPNINNVFAQYGNSNDGYCQDYIALNYGAYGECEYQGEPYCQDATANNFGAYGVCTYDERTGGGCTDPSASNYDSTATYSSGLCLYDFIYGCTDFTATNYNESANTDDGTCNYDETGCTDPRANNFNPNASVDNGLCTYNRGCTDSWAINYDPGAVEDDGSCSYGGSQPAKGELMQITFNGSELVDEAMCQDTTVPTDYFVNLQCKVCGNASLNIDIKYWNKGVDVSSAYNDAFTVNTDQVGNGHVFNNFVFGPYSVDYVLENKNLDGTINKSLYSNGTYTQGFAVQSTTQFGSEFCQVESSEGGYYVGSFTETEEVEIMCDLPAELRASFYIDWDGDGSKNTDEPYLKSDGNFCTGETAPLFGLIRNLNGTTFSGLSPSKCSTGTVPYLLKDLLPDGDYQAALDPDGSFGFIQTGVRYLVGQSWDSLNYISINAGDIVNSRIGVKLDSQYAGSVSCSVNPTTSKTFPVYATWTPTFWSDQYDLDEVEFVWDGVNTNSPDNQEIGGGTNSGKLTMWHTEVVPGTENEALDYYRLRVFAQHPISKQRLSNDAECTLTMNQMKVSCAAYPYIDSPVPQTFFNPGQDIFWKANVKNGGNNVTYDWSGAGVSNETTQIAGPVTYSTWGQKSVGIDAYGIDDTSAQNSCHIIIRQCGSTLTDCDEGYYCNQNTFMCVPDLPIFEQLLSLDPAVMNIQDGQQCRLKWIADDADTCTVYKNGVEYPVTNATSTAGTPGLGVDPGTYTITCRNSYEDVDGENVVQEVYGGPVRCLVNPDIREQ